MEDDSIRYQEELFAKWQQTLLIVIPYVTGPISFFSSATIAYVFVHDWSRKRHHLYHRLLFTMSVCDMIGSINFSFSGLYIPKEYQRFASHGTIASCEVAGFLTQFSVSMPLLNMFLCLFYMRVVCYGWQPPVFSNPPTDRRSSRYLHSRSRGRQIPWFEMTAYFLAVAYPLGMGGVALHYKSFNPMVTLPGWCYFSEVPYDCNKNDEVECIRGENYSFIQLFASTIPVGCAVIIGIIAVTMVTRSVKGQCRRMILRYGISTSFSVDLFNQDGSAVTSPNTQLASQPSQSDSATDRNDAEGTRSLVYFWRYLGIRRQVPSPPPPSSFVNMGHLYTRLQETAGQARLYTMAFIVTYVVPISQAFTGAFLEAVPKYRLFFFTTGILITVFTPLQGLWNLIIYMRPYYRHVKRAHPHLSFWRAAMLAVAESTQSEGSIVRRRPVVPPRTPSSENDAPIVAPSTVTIQIQSSGEIKQTSSVVVASGDQSPEDMIVIDPSEFETFELNLVDALVVQDETSATIDPRE